MLLVVILSVVGLVSLVVWKMRQRHLHRWLPAYLRGWPNRRLPRRDEPVHLLLCIADHYEPFFGGVSREQALARVSRWIDEYPK